MKKYIIGLAIFIVCILMLGMCIGGDDEAMTDEFIEMPLATDPEHETPNTPVNQTGGISNELKQEEYDISSMLSVRFNKDVPSQIIKRIGYIVSYNNVTKCPNWVAWHLTSEHTDGPYQRKGIPYCDEDGQNAYGIGTMSTEIFQKGYFIDNSVNGPRQEFSDWNDKSYNVNHGHMCPAGDNKWDKSAMNQTFLLTNICPQNESLNSGGWNKLEEKCRTWAKRYGDIYIVTGPIFNGNTINRTIGEGKIGVPDAFFKVILCQHPTPKAIGFIYINDSSSQYIEDKACSVDEIENLSGFDFFSELPDETEKEIESSSNYNQWK